MECACCFDDVPMSKITHCNGEIPHFFCYECARRNADNDVGSNKYDLQCMHECGCEATFGREERAKFLDLKMIEKIDNLEQQACIQGAMHGLADFVTCPFCHYGQICPPAEEDREFRCNHPDCREVSWITNSLAVRNFSDRILAHCGLIALLFQLRLIRYPADYARRNPTSQCPVKNTRETKASVSGESSKKLGPKPSSGPVSNVRSAS